MHQRLVPLHAKHAKISARRCYICQGQRRSFCDYAVEYEVDNILTQDFYHTECMLDILISHHQEEDRRDKVSTLKDFFESGRQYAKELLRIRFDDFNEYNKFQLTRATHIRVDAQKQIER